MQLGLFEAAQAASFKLQVCSVTAGEVGVHRLSRRVDVAFHIHLSQNRRGVRRHLKLWIATAWIGKAWFTLRSAYAAELAAT